MSNAGKFGILEKLIKNKEVISGTLVMVVKL